MQCAVCRQPVTTKLSWNAEDAATSCPEIGHNCIRCWGPLDAEKGYWTVDGSWDYQTQCSFSKQFPYVCTDCKAEAEQVMSESYAARFKAVLGSFHPPRGQRCKGHPNVEDTQDDDGYPLVW
jgi:hypothetical protein